MSILCCGVYHSNLEDIILADTEVHSNCRLEISYCPKCGAKICALSQWNKRTQQREYIKPKKRNVHKFIEDVLKRPYYERFKPIKYGVKENQNYIYGINREYKKQNQVIIKQFACDFNGTRTLVKEIIKSL